MTSGQLYTTYRVTFVMSLPTLQSESLQVSYGIIPPLDSILFRSHMDVNLATNL
jgi:hypothetical protein